MKKMILFNVLIFVCIATNAYCLLTGKLTLLVKDEQGIPVEGAKAYISYSKPEIGGVGVADILKEGLTGKEGLFTAESSTMSGVGLSAEKFGYYTSNIHYEFTSHSKPLNHWEPWNPTIEVVLKKKRNPVPMYIKYTDSIKMPALGTPVGYDLEIGDWVAPYGSGKISDFVFNFNSVDRAWTDYDCGYTLTFSNEKDGIQEYTFDSNVQSSYRWPFQAPEEGYTGELKRSRKDSPKTGLVTNAKDEINYLFRVRTKTDQNGNIVEARYGKIKGEINVWPGKVKFFYYFNPDGTNNLEEEPEENLFKK